MLKEVFFNGEETLKCSSEKVLTDNDNDYNGGGGGDEDDDDDRRINQYDVQGDRRTQ